MDKDVAFSAVRHDAINTHAVISDVRNDVVNISAIVPDIQHDALKRSQDQTVSTIHTLPVTE